MTAKKTDFQQEHLMLVMLFFLSILNKFRGLHVNSFNIPLQVLKKDLIWLKQKQQ